MKIGEEIGAVLVDYDGKVKRFLSGEGDHPTIADYRKRMGLAFRHWLEQHGSETQVKLFNEEAEL